MNRNSLAALVAALAVIVTVILGFRMLGSPSTQRLLRSDLRTIQSLAGLAQQLNFKWNNSKAIPETLQDFPDSAKQNPITHEPFLYHRKSGSSYELCATFLTDDRDIQNRDSGNTWDSAHWAHSKGRYCFQLDASQPVPQVPIYY